MIICIDSGNTRIKWGAHDGKCWVAQGAVAHADVEQLAQLADDWPQPARVMLANVAGPAAAEGIADQLRSWQSVWHEVRSTLQAGGVVNGYKQPERLGVDRWCALIGAWALTGTSCVVVMAGTATTIDTLDVDGRFLGGLILPGLDLMRHALARDTAGLPFANGHHVAFPTCTDDAIVSGIVEAQLGAIERAFQRLAEPTACCLLSGGNAHKLAGKIPFPVRQVDNLPLEGLLRLASESTDLN